MGLVARALVSVPLLLVAAWLIYSFGAGYFHPVAVPTPLNLLLTLVLSAAVLAWVYRFLKAA